MTPIQARQITLKEIIDWCEQQMNECEGKDNWVFLGSFPDQAADDALFFEEPVRIIQELGENIECMGESGRQVTVHKNYLENRKHLDVDRYNAFKEMKEKCNELMNSISVAA